ncbi:MAG: ABC transporter substrate-binding protein [Oligoflexia bacterium]|nr:ABC transporter substrate-binding protein [Oligoflexia bacterium]
MIKIINLVLISVLSMPIGLVQADSRESGESNSNLSIEQKAQAGSVFSDPEEFVSALFKKTVDFEEDFRERDNFLIQLGNYFDFPVMARFVLGRTVKKIDTAQLKEFIALFTESQVLSLLPSLKNIDSLKLIRKKSGKKNKTLLIFSYTGENNKPIEIGIYVKEVSEGLFKIYDVRIEGIRMLMSWRSEFQSLIRSKGFEGMMNDLRDKLEKN